MATSATDRFRLASGRHYTGLDPEKYGPDAERTPFHFVQMADTQLGMERSFNKKVEGWEREVQLMAQAVEEVNRIRPAFAIVCGDLVDTYAPGERGGKPVDESDRAKQEADFKRVMQGIDDSIPLMCVCGNHDIGNRPNSLTIKRFTEHFGDDYFVFWCHGVKCLVVNSQLWKDDSDAVELREMMDTWLDKELDTAAVGSSPPRILIFSHIPPFIFRPDEENGYFNLEVGFRQRLLAKLTAKGVVAWFCGHYHRNAGGHFCDEEGREMEVVVTGAVGTQIIDKADGNPLELSGIGGGVIGDEVSGLRLVHVLSDRIEHEWKTFRDLRKLPKEDFCSSFSRGASPAKRFKAVL